MGKRTRDSGQFAFDFDAIAPSRAPAAFAGLEAQFCRAAGDMLHRDPRPRELIAAEMSILLDEEISRAMLDAMASPARDGHRVHVTRFMILALVCGCQDIVDRVLRPLGMAVLVGDEVNTARLGHLDRQIAELRAERQALAGRAPLIRGRSNT